jgi:hypothetical protein
MNRPQAQYWLKQARAKARNASAPVRLMVAKAIRRFRELCRGIFGRLKQGYGTANYREAEQAGRAWGHLAWIVKPYDPTRNRLRDVVKREGDALARATARYLTLNSEYVARRSFDKSRYAPIAQTHPWRGLLTNQSPCKAFESGHNVLPGMERFIEPERAAA